MADERKAGDAGGRHRTVDRRAGDFGTTLREARERKGVSLRDIANATKISIRALEALERNDISHLPGGIFSRSFVRAYAVQAGLNPDETVDDFVRQFPHDSVIAGHAASSHVDDTDDESNRRTARVAMWLVAISVPVAAGVLYLGVTGRRTPFAAPGPASSSVRAETVVAGVGVEVTALRPCLLTAGIDGQPLVDTHLEAGGRQTFDARTELMLTISDPAAVELMLNGQRARVPGADGVMTTMRLTPDNYKTFLANP